MRTTTLIIILGLLCLTGSAAAMGSTNYDLSWNVMGGGGGTGSSTSYGMNGTVGQITGIATSTNYRLQAGYWVTDAVEVCCADVKALDGYGKPTDPDGDCLIEDINGNTFTDWDDAVVFFWNTDWIEANEPVECFDFNRNTFIDWDDAVVLFWHE